MQQASAVDYYVCSAHAEVIPPADRHLSPSSGLLRTRGGDPPCVPVTVTAVPSAPHTRR